MLRKLIRNTLACCWIVITACACTQSDSPKSLQAEKITVQFHWIPDAHQLGFWIAVDKGFYKDKGLDVTLHPGGSDSNPIRDAVSGSADIAQVGGIEQVPAALSEGLPVRAIASIQRDSPHALISLSTKPIRNPTDFPGKTIAVAFGDAAELLLKAYMTEAGISDKTVKLVPFKFDLTPLMTGQVDAITGFATGQPATIEQLGRTPVVLTYSSLGIASYGYTLVSSEATLTKKGPSIKRFIDASRKGWEYTFAHPEESIQLLKKRFGDAVDEKFSQREIELLRPFMLDQSGRLSTWKLDEKRVATVIGYLEREKQLKTAVAAANVINNSYTE